MLIYFKNRNHRFFFQIYLKTNIFKIPGNVVLPEDKVQVDYKCTEQEAVDVDKEISELEAAVVNVSSMSVVTS